MNRTFRTATIAITSGWLAVAGSVGPLSAAPLSSLVPLSNRAPAAGPPILVAQLTEEERALQTSLPPEQAAQLLLEVGHRFEELGELTAARLLYREISERYGETIAASRGMERLAAIEGRPDYGTSLPPITRQPSGGAPPPPSGTPPGGSTPRTTSGLDQSGRLSIIVYSTVLATYAALAVPIYTEADETMPYGLALLIGAPVGLATSIYATRDRQVTGPQADIFVLASNLGLWHGLALGVIYDWQGHEIAGSAALGGLLGAGAGALIISPGRTRETAAAYSSLVIPYGIWFGLVASQIIEDDDDNFDVDGEGDDTTIGTMLIAGDAALVGTLLTLKQVELSRSRARLIGVSGAVGAMIGGAVDLLFGIDDQREAWITIGIGSVGGLVAGVALTADYDNRRGFSDPARAALPDPGPELSVLPLHLVSHGAAGSGVPSTAWRESLKLMGMKQGPTVGVTFLEARF